MFSKILRRPALAIVISILILFLGRLSIGTLPISQFPNVAPPSVVVTLAFPGASANVLVDSVLVILEQAINGVQDMRYMVSAGTSAGEATILIVFEPGSDPNVAVLNVQNRVQTVKQRLPPIVELEGIVVLQQMTSMLMYVNIYSTDPGHNQDFLYNYTFVNIVPEIKRVRGIGSANILGSRAFSMRVWLDLDRMRAYNVSSDDVMKAVREQSMIGSPGRLGQATGKTSQTVEYVLTWVGRYNKPEQYEDIILKANPDGQILRLKDVAQIETGPSYYNIYSNIDGNPSAAIVLKQIPGTNASTVIENTKKMLEEMQETQFPPGMKFEISYDVSSFLDASIEQVLHTLLEAFLLVSIVVYMFLGDVRSTLIPTLAVPVSLIGAFFIMQMFGLSINLITLFALVLAIGVVVDDAIVVVEAVHAKMAEKHLSPYLATKEVINEISGAIIAITLVMTAVFVPVTFIPGPVGQFYKQFGITMASSIVLSGVVALTITPVLCAMILKPHGHASHARQGGWLGRILTLVVVGGLGALVNLVVFELWYIKGLLVSAGSGIAVLVLCAILLKPRADHGGGFDMRRWLNSAMSAYVGGGLILSLNLLIYHLWGKWGLLLNVLPFLQKPFDRAVEKVTTGYTWFLGPVVTRRVLTMVVIGGFVAGNVLLTARLPAGFIPLEDQGMIYGILQTPPGSTLEYTNSKSTELQEIAKTIDGVNSVSAIAGYEVLTEGRGSNAGTCLINLKAWSERKMTSKQIIHELEKKCSVMTNVKLEFFEPPAVPGFGAAGGVSCRVLDRTNTMNYARLGEETEKFLAALNKRKELKSIFTFFASNYPQYEITINNDIAMQKGVSIKDAMDNLSIVIGSTWEQGFIRFNQFYKVFVQALPQYRRFPEDFENIFVKNDKGEMVPYSAFMTLNKMQGLNEINRYNLYPSAPIQLSPAPGYSSGQAIEAIKEVADQTLSRGYTVGWEALAYDEANKGDEAVKIFFVVVIFVYLVLVAQYESFILPLAVIVSLPVGIFGSFLLLELMGLANDVYCQIGLVMLVGLLGKNAILIVEFAVQRHHEGVAIKEAAIEGGKLRFRPILMTSFAFIAGLIPLVVASGPGAIGNRTIGGTAVGGMLLGTVLGVLVIPGLYYLFAWLDGDRKLLPDGTSAPLSEADHITVEHHT